MEYTGERFVLGKAEGEIETEHLHRYNAIMELANGKKVLDIACGEGFGAAILAKRAEHVWGVDISDEAISYAKEKYNRYNLEYKQGSVEKLDFEDNYFDMIVSFETIEHVDEVIQDKFLKEARRVLKTGGILLISTPDKFWYADVPNHRNQYHVKEFYFPEYKDFLEKQFKYVDFYNQNYSTYGLIVNRNASSKEHVRLINAANSQKEGKYIIALCSNEEIPRNVSINSLYENQAANNENEENEDFLQLYWADENNGFNESKSKKVKFKYSDEFQTFSFTIPNDSVRKIRLDIGNRPSSFQIKKEMIYKVGNEVILSLLNVDDVLGIVQLNSSSKVIDFISMSEDPQILLGNPLQEHSGELTLYIDLKIKKFDFNLCLNEINSYLSDMRNNLAQLDEPPLSTYSEDDHSQKK